VLRLDRGHAFLSLVPNSAEMRYIPSSALQPVPAEQQHAQSIALYGGALKLKSGGNAARISVGLDDLMLRPRLASPPIVGPPSVEWHRKRAPRFSFLTGR
jgi:hypothetical protein